jgi:transcriptional regulator with XRE-family HTH domain
VATANRRSVLQGAGERWQRGWIDLADELREARLKLGLTQAQVAAALGVTRSWVCRVELHQARRVTVDYLYRHAAIVGLKASVKLYPLGGAIRDEAQAKYIARFVERVGHHWRVMLDVPIPIPGDLRGIDVLLANGTTRIAVEVITRLRDLQAQIRAAQQKQRDIHAVRLILVIAATNANRVALAATRPTLLAAFELDSQRVMGALAAGRDPGRDAVIALRAA